ncbi:hypothetical protein J5X84_09505 [Streptosporangiaceae bacterium NEAU-GS5]|nr:hypothetical protein [Streptosporangiaceae bacterium NEAU-GS5]
MTTVRPERFVLDSGALIQVEHGDHRMIRLLDRVAKGDVIVTIPRTVVAETWRGGARQARLARLIKIADTASADTASTALVRLDELTPERADQIGLAIGSSGHDDIVDVHVALCARDPHRGTVDATIVTSDRDHIERVDIELKHVISDI